MLLHGDTPRDLLPASNYNTNEPPPRPGAKLALPPVKLRRGGGRGVHLSGAREVLLTALALAPALPPP